MKVIQYVIHVVRFLYNFSFKWEIMQSIQFMYKLEDEI